jgi:DNA-directed DNA polymerase III PolC
MADRKFAHLHLHTHYSMLDGYNRIPELVKQTKKLGMNALAITDHGNLYGAVEFHTECTKAGINPVLGYEAYLAPGDRREKKAARQGDAYSHLTLLAKNATGFKNLIKLASIAFLEGYYYHPRIDREVLKAHSEGLICLSGCLAGEFNQAILAQETDEAKKIAEWFARVFKKDFYIEIQNNGIGAQDLCTPVAADISDKLGVPLVATADAHYLCSDDAEAHDVLFCISTGQKRDPHKKRYPEEKMRNPYYVRTPEDMYRLFPDFEDAVARSQEIADGVDVQFDFSRRCFPVFKLPEKQTPESYLRELCEQGMKERYGNEPTEAAKKRLDHELGIIEKMGFASYFLVVWDFVRFAREQGIPCTARGSGCGAIVSYVLHLSHVCPVEYDLLFERFLDPSRKEAPDIDIDFCQDRRIEVIQYVKEKYGAESVAQIGTFGTLAAKAAIKDVGRVLDVPLDRVNALCKIVPMHGQIAGSLTEAKGNADFKREYESDPDLVKLIEIASKLEGCNRNVGTHAAGVVIADGPITDYVPVQRPPKKTSDDNGGADTDTVTTQWEMGILEKVGMLKMDFLGLRNLTVLDKCVKLIKRTRNEDIDPTKFPLEDKDTYALLQSGNAKGVFQLESEGIRDLLKRMKPDNIRDLIAVLALYRPGPLSGGMVDSYVNRKHGREKWDYPHPVLKDILDETYGVMVYQEQIMRILNRLGGIELSKAYACIKAISKKVEEKIAAAKNDFIAGCIKQKVDEATAEDIFAKIVHFAGYGFNKCVAAGTVITHAQTGERTTVGELFSTKRSFEIHALGDDGKLHARPVSDVVWNGRKKVHRLKTELGHEIIATGNHPFRVLDGWKNLDKLKPGERIAAPRKLDVPTTTSWPRHELITLAEELSPGGTDAAIPSSVTTLCDADIELLLGTMWMHAGEFEPGMSIAEIHVDSKQLAKDVQYLLTRLGIVAAVRRANSNGPRFTVRIAECGIAIFKDRLGRYLDETSAAWRAFSPKGWDNRALGLGAARRPGLAVGMKCSLKGCDTGTLHVAAFQAASCAHDEPRALPWALLSQPFGLNTVAHSDVFWDRIASIEPLGIQDTYDLTVDVDHNFVADGLIVHNSHTAAYAQIGYQTAYLKAHYTAEYMAALLSSEIDDGGKRDIMVDHIADTRKLGVDVLPPDVNRGLADFNVVNNRVLFGLTAIKGLGRGAANEIVRARDEGGEFKDLFEFAERVDRRIVQKSAVEKMIMAGAFDAFGKRAAHFAAVAKAFQAADERASDLRRGQKSIFEMFTDDGGDTGGGSNAGGGLPDVPEWPDTEKLKFEKEALDFYMSSHPLAQHEDQLKRFRTHDAAQAVKLPHGSPVLVAGMVTGLQMRTVQKNGKRWAMFQLEDFTGQCKCILWSDEYARFKDQVVDDVVMLFEGAVEWREGGTAGDVIVRKILTIDEAKKEMTRSLLLRMPYADDVESLRKLEAVGAVLKRNRGATPVYMSVKDGTGRQVKLKLGGGFQVNVADIRAEEIEMILGPGSIVFTR